MIGNNQHEPLDFRDLNTPATRVIALLPILVAHAPDAESVMRSVTRKAGASMNLEHRQADALVLSPQKYTTPRLARVEGGNQRSEQNIGPSGPAPLTVRLPNRPAAKSDCSTKTQSSLQQ